MINITNLNLYKAIFVSEGNNRFICNIKFNNQIIECYIPMTCKLNNFISINSNDDILIAPTTQGAKRTKYSLFAIKNYTDYIIVNASFANEIVKTMLLQNKSKDKFYPEQFIENYKCDFYSKSTKTLVEVKSVITTKEVLILPNIITTRAITQLQHICSLLSKGYKVEYYIIAFAPRISQILFDTSETFAQLLNEALYLGCKINCIKISINETYNITFDNITYYFK